MLKLFFSKQFSGFLLAGGLAAFLHWWARILLSLFLPFSWAVIIAYGIGMTIALLLNSYFVFPASDKPLAKQARDFFAINLAFFPVVWIASLQLNEMLVRSGVEHYTHEIAHGLAITVPVLATFLFYKFFAFRENYHG
ncbi:MAG: GtrA family protein [Halieaceae bacterium]